MSALAVKSAAARKKALGKSTALSSKLERKEAGGGSVDWSKVTDQLLDLGKVFEEFKSANDERLKILEARAAKGLDTKSGTDPILEEKLAKINTALDARQSAIDDVMTELKRIETAAARSWRDGGGRGLSAEQEKAAAFALEHKQAFQASLVGDDSGYVDLQKKTMSSLVNPDGGYLVPTEMSTEFIDLIEDFSPMRELCNVKSIESRSYEIPVNVHGATATWASERQSRSQTTTPQLEMLDIPADEIYAMPAITQILLEDAGFDVEAWLMEELLKAFSDAEGRAFISGSGVKKPRGILNPSGGFTTESASTEAAWGKVGRLITGVNGGFKAVATGVNPADDFVALSYHLRSKYRRNATWLMNRFTLSTVRQFKDGQNNYIWQPSLTAGQPSTLLGYPVRDMDDFPDMADDSYSVAFGDWREAYQIVDRLAMSVVRDDLTDKPNVLLYTRRRLGGSIRNYQAYKVLQLTS